MRKKLAVIAAALIIPAGAALAVTVATAAPAQASASNCQELADAFLYHAGIGNYEYANQLEAWWLAAGCAN